LLVVCFNGVITVDSLHATVLMFFGVFSTFCAKKIYEKTSQKYLKPCFWAAFFVLFALILSFSLTSVFFAHSLKFYDVCDKYKIASSWFVMNYLESDIEWIALKYRQVLGLIIVFIGSNVGWVNGFIAALLGSWIGIVYSEYKNGINSRKRGVQTCFYFVIILLSCIILSRDADNFEEYFNKDGVYIKEMIRKDAGQTPQGIKFGDQFIVEPVVGTKRELDSFLDVVSAYKIRGVFLSAQLILWLKNHDLLGYFTVNIDKLKHEHGLKVFCDIEATFDDAELLRQLLLGVSWNADAIYSEAREYAKKISADYRVDYVLGPVLDRKLSHADTTISYRSFGVDPDAVYHNAAALILGLRAGGVQSIPKHFPGHPQKNVGVSNPHHGFVTTTYSDVLIKQNALPFLRLSKNRFVGTRAFLTDHVTIPSVSQAMPYTLVSGISNGGGGVAQVSKALLGEKLAQDMVFVSDDITMVFPKELRVALENGGSIDTDVASRYIDDAFYAGHHIVLMRSVTPKDLRKIFDRLAQRHSGNTQAEARQRHIGLFYSMVVDTFDAQVRDSDYQYKPLVVNMASKELSQMNLDGLSEKKLVYASTSYSVDDFEYVFCKKEGSVSQNCIEKFMFKRKGSSYEEKIKNSAAYVSKSTNIAKADYVVVVVHDHEIQPFLEAVVNYLGSIDRLDRLIVVIADSPDIIYRCLPYQKAVNVLGHSNVLCVFSNSRVASNMVFKALVREPFKDMLQLDMLTVDLPDFYYAGSNANKVNTSDVLLRVISGPQISAISNSVRLQFHYLVAAIVLFVMSVVFEGAVYALSGSVPEICKQPSLAFARVMRSIHSRLFNRPS